MTQMKYLCFNQTRNILSGQKNTQSRSRKHEHICWLWYVDMPVRKDCAFTQLQISQFTISFYKCQNSELLSDHYLKLTPFIDLWSCKTLRLFSTHKTHNNPTLRSSASSAVWLLQFIQSSLLIASLLGPRPGSLTPPQFLSPSYPVGLLRADFMSSWLWVCVVSLASVCQEQQCITDSNWPSTFDNQIPSGFTFCYWWFCRCCQWCGNAGALRWVLWGEWSSCF